MATGTQYFLRKASHSEIKHKIFQDTFTAALSIANYFSKKTETFVYCDLYAGQGEFEDGNFGSPLIALKSIQDMCLKLKSLRLSLYFMEQDERRIQQLHKNLQHQLENNRCKRVASIKINEGDWHNYYQELQKILHVAKWGFIFVDPFANEMDLNTLKELIEKNYRKDVMIFLNLQAIRRLAGSQKTKSLVAEFLNVEKSDINSKLPDDKLFELIRKSFILPKKSFNMLAAIPNSRQGKLTNSDYFSLLCATNSIGVADAFLKSYANSIGFFKNNNTLEGLFGGITLEEKILENIESCVEITLHEIFIMIMNSFFGSWKNIDLTELPSAVNLLDAINKLGKENRIEIDAPTDFFDKKTRYPRLTQATVRKNESMKKITLRKQH